MSPSVQRRKRHFDETSVTGRHFVLLWQTEQQNARFRDEHGRCADRRMTKKLCFAIFYHFTDISTPEDIYYEYFHLYVFPSQGDNRRSKPAPSHCSIRPFPVSPESPLSDT